MNANNAATSTLFGKQEWVGRTNLDLSVVVPTRNEAGNIELLLERIQNAFSGASFSGSSIEVIFVDDSTDDTPQVVESAARHFPDLHVQLIHREADQRTDGLGGAVVTGLAAALSRYACVMDADLQHPPEMVPLSRPIRTISSPTMQPTRCSTSTASRSSSGPGRGSFPRRTSRA
jgi:glycosyltransferase involved in cell wall biosynthesis